MSEDVQKFKGWDKVLEYNMPLNVMLNTYQTKGNLVYEYNPFRNYRLTTSTYLYKNEYYTQEQLKKEYNITLDENKHSWIGVPNNETDPILYEKGQLVDFITDEFKFSLDHPVHIIPQYSYDGSVNLIINDGLNTPRLINSRFSATGKNTYEIIDRKGNTDTNIYDQGEQFDIDTSLYKIVDNIPKITFLRTAPGGNMKVGNYHFYFKLADSDGNETDFVAESGLVSVFIGEGSYASVHTGTKNENSAKQIEFGLSNIDSAYDYIIVYYSRTTAELGNNSATEYAKIDKKFGKTNTKLVITGFEDIEYVSVTDINLNYNIVSSAQTSAVCQNMLFMGNVKKQDIPYEELSDLSLRILPFLGTEDYDPGLDHNYSSKNPKESYINANYIYNKTGYWPGELYRFGIVYILPNGELTPVFNIRGAYDIGYDDTKGFLDIPLWTDEKKEHRRYIKYNDNTFFMAEDDAEIFKTGAETTYLSYENVKGVCSFRSKGNTRNVENAEIYYVNFCIPAEVRELLKNYVKGYFFVRQTRMPLKLAQGVTIGIDNESRTPTIPTAGGVLERLQNTLDKTHVETENINGLNYISEGFLKRYTFHFKEKSSRLWGKIGKIVGIAALVVGAAAAALYTGGASFMFVGSLYTSVVGPIAGAIGGSVAVAATTVGLAAAAAGAVAGAVVGGIIASGQEIGQAISRIGEKKRLNGKATVAPSGFKIVESEDSRQLTASFDDRIIIKDETKNSIHGIICPDYTVNQPYFNQIFTGNEHYIEVDNRQSDTVEAYSTECYFTNEYRHFYISKYTYLPSNTFTYAKVLAVPDNITCTGIDDVLFRSRAGESEEAWRYKCIGQEYTETAESSQKKINSDIIRGSFSPYLGFINNSIGPAKIVNIYIPGYDPSNIQEYIQIRMSDNSTYNAITDRIDINQYESKLIGDKNEKPTMIAAYRGDCYICQYTQRIIRNFNDPSAPYNDDIVDINTWKDNYDPSNTEKYQQINLGDVNAVPLGMWVTFQLRSSNNLNIRTLDSSEVDESAMTGHPRGYFPAQPMSTEGVYKKPESHIYNKGFTKSLSERWNIELPDVPHIKNWFGTRIMYSDIHITDAYKNGFRVFQGTNYRDYTREYGEIVKLIPFESSLLCVFEHGIALIDVNGRTLTGQGAGGMVYVNSANVLPENPKIISDTFGSQWPESVLKVPGKTGDAAQYVYGVDTIAKKIWRTNGNTLECISDFRVQEFLNNNITLGERELTPKIGIRNVKTHYNAFKRDVMFTFYDNTYGFEEKVWNLCWNELLNTFVTFYSWVPSYMENINNIPFSFNRDTSKWIAKLGTSHADNSFADGITLTSVIIDKPLGKIPIEYVTKNGQIKTIYYDTDTSGGFIGGLCLSNRVLPTAQTFYNIHYTLEKDNYQNYKDFDIKQIGAKELPSDAKFAGKTVPIYALFYKGDVSKFYSELYYRNSAGNSYADKSDNKQCYINYDDDKKPVSLQTAALSLPIYKSIEGKRINLPRKEQLNPDKLVRLLNIRATIQLLDYDETVNLPDDYYNLKAGFESGTTLMDAGYYESVVAVTPQWNLQFLSTDFWKHGQAGLIDIADDIYPTYWYGKQHPFEFEVVVVNDPSVHKIFSNLELVANKAKPESFHYEIIGECYDFAKDKPNMYFRQEALKALWQYNGADITYNRNFLKVQPKQQPKSADLPHKYYTRQDTINDVEDYYINITYPQGYDYRHLSGAEIVYYPNRQEYRIWNHSKAVDIDNDLSRVTEKDSGCRGLIAGNMTYLEDKWKITINPILVCYKNEYTRRFAGTLTTPVNSTWTKSVEGAYLPNLTIYNSPIPDKILAQGEIKFPNTSTGEGKDNALYGLYADLYSALDPINWLKDNNIYNTNFGEAQNRKELDLKDKFMKVRIRYSGEELAVIDFLNTIYRVSYA